VIDFLKMHYVLTETHGHGSFWRDNRRPASIPDRLQEQLALWRHLPPSRYDFFRIEGSLSVGELSICALRDGLPARIQWRAPPLGRCRPLRLMCAMTPGGGSAASISW